MVLVSCKERRVILEGLLKRSKRRIELVLRSLSLAFACFRTQQTYISQQVLEVISLGCIALWSWRHPMKRIWHGCRVEVTEVDSTIHADD